MAEIKLTEEQEDEIFELITRTDKLAYIGKQYGFTRSGFAKYMAKHPDFFAKVERARAATCMYLEDDLLSCADDNDPKVARVKMESIAKILKYRDPKRYGDKIDMSVNHTIDISGSLERAERRIIDVTASNVIAIAHGKKTED